MILTLNILLRFNIESKNVIATCLINFLWKDNQPPIEAECN